MHRDQSQDTRYGMQDTRYEMDTSRYIGIQKTILIVFLPIALASLSSGCASGLGPFVSGDDKTKEPVIDRGGRSVIESIDFVNNRK